MAGGSKIAGSLEKLVKNSANLVGTLEIGVNKILWGSNNRTTVQTVDFVPGNGTTTGSLQYKSTVPPANPDPPKANLVNSGLYNALDALNSVDLCSVMTYAVDQINIKKKKRPDKSTWTAAQTSLYFLQDQAATVRTYIDKYTAFPNTFVSSYSGFGLNAQTTTQAVSQSNAPADGGTAVTAYNTYFLMQSIKDVFESTLSKQSTSGSLFTSEEQTLLAEVPGLVANTNIVQDFLGTFRKYTDYTQISNADLLKLQKKISTLRSVCVVIENSDFKGGLALAGNFLNTDIRSQIQKLSKFVDPTRIVDTLKQINSAIQSFIRIAKQIQGILTLGQFVIKLGLLFYKVFKFILYFFGILPIPMMFSTAGAQTKIQDAKDAAKNESDGVVRILKAINALLAVVVNFIRYVLANTNELLIRLQTLLAQLQGCGAVKDSDVVDQLLKSLADLQNLKDELESYIIKYDSKTDPNTSLFGNYDIRVVDEEITDPSVKNKRRRGIALDVNGNLVTASDLTFATNTDLIIAEVKQKLIALRLVQPSLGVLNGDALSVISTSIDYLDNNDVIQDDLNLSQDLLDQISIDAGDNSDESSGLGLNAFVNNLPGGKKLRKRVQSALAATTSNLKSQISTEKTQSQQSLKTTK